MERKKTNLLVLAMHNVMPWRYPSTRTMSMTSSRAHREAQDGEPNFRWTLVFLFKFLLPKLHFVVQQHEAEKRMWAVNSEKL